MDWFNLGHAMWLCEAAGLRLLFDPLLTGVHHGDVFDFYPRREVDAEALQPDFIIVSHRHPDHFDVASLRRLSELDAEAVVVTSDSFVARIASRLGFSTVKELGPRSHVALDGVGLLTSASHGTAVEWGMMVEEGGVVAWNQVDTVHRNVDDVAAARGDLERALGCSEVELLLARWQPLLEIQAAIGDATGFPHREYAALLDQVAAVEARAVVPAAAGMRHQERHAFMNRLVYPVPEARFLRDVQARQPEVQALENLLGARYAVSRDGVEVDPSGGRALLGSFDVAAPDDRIFMPQELPPIQDPNPAAQPEPTLRERVAAWVRDELGPALERAYPGMQHPGELRCGLRVVFPTSTDDYTLVVSEAGVEVRYDFDPDYDVLNTIAGSYLVDVLEARRHWGEPLLAGLYRATHRAYTVTAEGTRRSRIGPTFLYYALGYEQSFERWIEASLEA